jgi:hypothetical protein
MKHLLLTTIAAVLVVGCGSEPNYSGNYTLTLLELDGGTVGQGKLTLSVELKPDGSFIATPPDNMRDKAIGSWKVEGGLLRLPPFFDHGSAFLRWNLPCPSSVL